MEYNNEVLAETIISIDQSADKWIYNRHCEYCGKFLYNDEFKCKKCKTPVKNPIKRPIPFLSSASAIEKLLIWLRTYNQELLKNIIEIHMKWAYSNRSAESYKLEVVIICINTLRD